MQRLKVVVLALMAVCALGALASSMAFGADAEFLPTASEAYTGTSGPATLSTLAGKEIACKKDTSSGTLSGRTATIHIDLSECKGEGGLVTCTGLGEASGVILALASGLLVYDSLSPLGVGFLITLTPIHASCSIVLVELTGKVICLITPINTAAKHPEIKCEMATPTSGDPKETVYWEGGVLKILSNAEVLLTSFNHGAAECSGMLTVELLLTTNNITIDG